MVYAYNRRNRNMDVQSLVHSSSCMPELTIAEMCWRDTENFLLCQLHGEDNFLIDFGAHELSANTFWKIFIDAYFAHLQPTYCPQALSRTSSVLRLNVLIVNKESGVCGMTSDVLPKGLNDAGVAGHGGCFCAKFVWGRKSWLESGDF